MFYNVIVKELNNNIYFNSLVFTFYELEEAINFASIILKMSNYCVEILQLEDEGE